ncbi:UNVERIFIED_CONTAM: zinc finger and SCAN domain-containing protein 22 [Trichonephila clavipes]
MNSSEIKDGKLAPSNFNIKKNHKSRYCNKTFFTSRGLKRHLKFHSKENVYNCDICKISFNSIRSLERHERVHTEKISHSCEICKASFRNMCKLKEHLRTHTNEKPYSCLEFNKSYSRRNKLSLHLLTDTKESPYACEVCQKTFLKSQNFKTFSQNQNLKRHWSIHTKEKPLACEICMYAEFLHKSNEKFTDFERVKQEIIDETMKDPGPTGFSSKPITLKIYAPNVLKLTFVDMPGRVKDVGSNLSSESVEDLERMILEYIQPSNSVILAVSPANQDIETSDALEMAYRVDPELKFPFKGL